jgi:hypothetical protein
MIVGLFALYPTFSSLMNSVVIKSTGTISTSTVTAKSGSPIDIQTAVNEVAAAGGGTVYIPAGTFTFNPSSSSGVGVTIPACTGPISIIGAGCGTLAEYGDNDTITGTATILEETYIPSSSGSCMFSGTGEMTTTTQAAPVRISGISFVGYMYGSTTDNFYMGAIELDCCEDFRIDHCNFVNFASCAIETDSNTGGTAGSIIDRGVIDHCSIDNPYRNDEQPHNASGTYYASWGYGILVVGNDQAITSAWDPNIGDYLGYYYPTTTAYWTPVPQPIYIENCIFSRCRHGISSNGGGYYVSRYNYFQQAFYGQNDMHGGSSVAASGTRGIESYSNVFNFTDESYSDGQDCGIEDRGGGGVVWNNTVIVNPGYSTPTVALGNDGESYPYDVEQLYIWNNTAIWSNGTLANFNSLIQNQDMANGSDYVEGVNYFLFAPNGTSANGLTGPTSYMPYTYPLPLTQTSLTSGTTSSSMMLAPATYSVTIPTYNKWRSKL